MENHNLTSAAGDRLAEKTSAPAAAEPGAVKLPGTGACPGTNREGGWGEAAAGSGGASASRAATPFRGAGSGDFLAALERLTRSGFRCSEFWLVVCAIGLFALDARAGDLSPKWMAALSTLLVLGYKYFRVAVKTEGAEQVVQLADGVLAAGGLLAPGSNGAAGGDGAAGGNGAQASSPVSAASPAALQPAVAGCKASPGTGGDACAPQLTGGDACAPQLTGGDACAPQFTGGDACAPQLTGGDACAPGACAPAACAMGAPALEGRLS